VFGYRTSVRKADAKRRAVGIRVRPCPGVVACILTMASPFVADEEEL
jgi:hypothetical protein